MSEKCTTGGKVRERRGDKTEKEEKDLESVKGGQERGKEKEWRRRRERRGRKEKNEERGKGKGKGEKPGFEKDCDKKSRNTVGKIQLINNQDVIKRDG